MATLKHLGSKNADYGAAEQYLLFEHDEFTMKPVLDENGRLIPREDYRLSTLNCGGEDFAVACMRSNLRYEKNQRREDVKSHHYIISFDPRDGPDNGLTVDRAQALGEQFCKEHFPGHQALVCTHPDGHNHSGNIHVHIVINSLRIEEVPFLPYMDRPADTKAGCKHRCTDAALRYFKSEVMEMCHREGLYQIDLLNGSKNRVTDREYWAQKKGQAALDKQNAPMIAGGITPRQTKFETNKEKLRQTLRKALATAASFDEFSSLLLREGVTVKESRGRLSYLTPDRTKPITARKLGGDFDRTAVLAVLEQNAQRGVTVRYTPQHQAARAAEQTAAIPEYLHAGKGRLQGEKTGKIDPRQDSVQRLVDIEQKMAEGKGKGYERWAKMLIVQDQVWGRVTANRSSGKSTRYYMDEMHLLLKEEQTAAYSVEIWKRFRKWGGIPTGLTQNVKDLLSSREVENIFENSDMIIMLNQAAGDRQILAKQLNISPHQLSYVTHSGEGEGLLFFGNVILPFVDRFPTDLELYRIMTTKLGEVSEGAQK